MALKDLDFDQDNIKISVDEDVKQALIKQIEIDVSLFKLLEINDYSVLLGVHDLTNPTEGTRLIEKHDSRAKSSF